MLAVGLGLALPSAAGAAVEKPAAPAQPQPVRVEGFRSAHWGMTEAQVKAAIRKDFRIPADKVHTEENRSERTTVLTVTVDDLLDGAGKARVSYILGYSTKKLIEVNIVWGTTVDSKVKPESIVAAANQLRTLFLSSGYDPKTIAGNVATGHGRITVFEGEDAEKRMTVLRLLSAEAPASTRQHHKGEVKKRTVVLVLSYVEKPTDPDIYRLKKGQF